MLLIGLVIAVNSSGEWAKELEAVSQAPFIFVGAFIALYAVIVIPTVAIISKDTTKTMEAQYGGEIKASKANLEGETKQNKRLEAKITELEKQLLSQPTPTSQALLKPVSVFETSTTQASPPLLKSKETKGQSSLKIRAYKLAKQIEKAIEKALSKEQINNNRLYNVETGVVLEVISTGFVPYEQTPHAQALRIAHSALEEYDSQIHDTALEIRDELLTVSKNKPLSLESYSCPQSLSDLQEISNDLRSLADCIH
jgi:hypothetical protein